MSNGVQGPNISDDRMIAATGRARDEWHTLLDAAGAATWTHPQIARWLVEEHAVDGWWAQGITVGYEHARGTRLPGQQPDGTFAVTVTRTVIAPKDVVLQTLIDALSERFGAPASANPAAKYASARWSVDGETWRATASDAGEGRTRAGLDRTRMRTPELAAAKESLRELLDAALAGLA